MAMALVVDVYETTKCFPKQELYGLASQMQRAAVSVPSNIAEGQTRDHTAEYLHHISIAQASLAELETQVEIASMIGYCHEVQLSEVLAKVVAVQKQLYLLRNALREKQRAARVSER